MISSVSFSGAQASNFQDLISKPQSYTNPNAASGINDSFEKKGSKVKKAGMAIAGAAVIAGALALGHKFGLSEKIPAVGKYVDIAGAKVCQAGSYVKNKAVELFGKFTSPKGEIEFPEAVEEGLEAAADAGAAAVEATV